MGMAEVVPGVSGGTMAFITGIYHQLVSSLASFGIASIPMLAQPGRFFIHHNMRFLLLLAAGMGLGVIMFAQLMHFLLAYYQPLVWAFFSGVILMSVIVIGRVRAPAALLRWMPLGAILGLALLWLPNSVADAGYLKIFVGGMIAVCAWLLPAVSGSYVLLAMGLYVPVIEAVAALDFALLSVLGAGCLVGMFSFARALAWLLRHHSEALLSLLTGFMLGSLPNLWPWQAGSGSAGIARLLSPQEYFLTQLEPAYTFLAVLMVVLGGIALWSLSKLANDS